MADAHELQLKAWNGLFWPEDTFYANRGPQEQMSVLVQRLANGLHPIEAEPTAEQLAARAEMLAHLTESVNARGAISGNFWSTAMNISLPEGILVVEAKVNTPERSTSYSIEDGSAVQSDSLGYVRDISAHNVVIGRVLVTAARAINLTSLLSPEMP